MINRTTRPIRIAVLTLALAIIAACFLNRPTPIRAEPAAPADATKLRQEQVETLSEASKLANEMFKKGAITFAEVVRIDRMLTEAQLKSAPTAKEKIAVLQDALDAARKQEEQVTAMMEGGLVSKLVALEAKSYRLDVEIQLSEMENVK